MTAECPDVASRDRNESGPLTAPLLILLLLVLLSRLLFFSVSPPGVPLGDEPNYESAAANLAAGRGARLDPIHVTSFSGDERELFIHNRNIGYVAFVAASYRLFGPSKLPVFVAQSLLDAAAAVLLLLLCLRIGLSRVGAFFTALAAFVYPISALFNFMLLAETLFSFLCLLVTWLLVIASRRSYGTWIAAGLTCGLAALTRSSLLLFPIFVLVLFFRMPSPSGRGMRFAILVVFLISFAVPTGLWILRNQRVLGEPIFQYGGGWTLYESNNPLADGGVATTVLPLEEEGRKLPPLERDRFFQRAAREWIMTNPGRFIALIPQKFIRFWNIVPNAERFRRSPWFELSAVFHILLYGLALTPFLTKRGRAIAFSTALPALLLIVYFTLLHVVFLGSLRYRVPIMPPVFLFAGLGAEELFLRVRRRANGAPR